MLSATQAFLEAAVRSQLLDARTADEVRALAESKNMPATRAALETGTLTHEQIEIVEMLLHSKHFIPGYELQSLLGEGGMGVVFRAKQNAFDRTVALKLVKTGSANANLLARFEQEARTIGRLAHPHIVTAYDFGRHENRLFLAMEFLDGKDAEQYVAERGPLPESVAWLLIRQAAAGLMFAAQHGVTHRDIKPANLMLVDPPTGIPLPPGVPFVKVADFGLALLHEGIEDRTRLTQENSTVGSPLYMAPEQLTGTVVDQRADIYALGATAYRFLAHKPPFDGLSIAQLFARKLHDDPQSLAHLEPSLSPQSVEIVSAMMHRDPGQRIQNYEDLLSRIDIHVQKLTGACSSFGSVTASEGTQKPPSAAVPRSVEPSSPKKDQRRRWVGLSAAVVTFGVIALALLMWWPWSPKGRRDWVRTGWEVQCFDGVSLNGWRPIRGSWTPGQDDGQGGRVLAGRGAIGYPIAKPVNDALHPLKGFRVLVVVQLNDAGKAEIEFGDSERTARAGAETMVLQLTPQAIRWGRRATPTGALTTIRRETPITESPQTPHELKVEHQGGQWLVSVDGAPFATERASPPPEEFRLACEAPRDESQQPAWFSDVILEELAPATQASTILRSNGP